MNNARNAWLVPAIISLLALAASGFAAYSAQSQAAAIDVSVLQNQQKNDHERLERIELKVDEIRDIILRRQP